MDGWRCWRIKGKRIWICQFNAIREREREWVGKEKGIKSGFRSERLKRWQKDDSMVNPLGQQITKSMMIESPWNLPSHLVSLSFGDSFNNLKSFTYRGLSHPPHNLCFYWQGEKWVRSEYATHGDTPTISSVIRRANENKSHLLKITTTCIPSTYWLLGDDDSVWRVAGWRRTRQLPRVVTAIYLDSILIITIPRYGFYRSRTLGDNYGWCSERGE